jgi:uncharacterized DUF497 family protein
MVIMEFEWSDEKAEDNFRVHHIRFEEAAFIFDDPLRIIRRDDDSSTNEERWQTIGTVGRVLFVVYTERGEDGTRLISARLATPKERRIYGNSETYPYGWKRADS